MLLDPDTYETARQARDPRFDGRFYVGVVTTGIYCRPVCPVRIPKRENIQLYPSAAAASDAGFRPCLRCRPETSPGTPAWLGSSHTVSLGLELIAEGVLDEGSVEDLAAMLNIGPRQLSRLFKLHIGASPIAVAQTRRLHFAKQLIDETAMPMVDICFAAGFGSIRRFNSVFKRTYTRSPRLLRRKDAADFMRGAGVDIRLHYRPPFDWRAMLNFLAARAISGVERVTDDSYYRNIQLEGIVGNYTLTFSDTGNYGTLHIEFPETRFLLKIVEQVRRQFDLKADSREIEDHLQQDPLLAPLAKQWPGLRVPGCWDGFEIAVRAILGQQVSIKAARTLLVRLLGKTAGTADLSSANDKHERPTTTLVFPTPEQVLVSDLSGLGITSRRIAAIKALAQAVVDGAIRFDRITDTDSFIHKLCEIRGIGPWTAQYIALRALRDPNAFPAGDLILRRAAAEDSVPLTSKQLTQRAHAWQPWRAYSVLLLWRHYQHTL